MIKKILWGLGGLVVLLLLIILIRTFSFSSLQIEVEPAEKIEVSPMASQHLAEAIRFKTISYDDPAQFDPEPFLQFREFLRSTYPNIESQLSKELINGHSILYKWQGTNPDLNPLILLAHMDVVPIEESSADEWQTDPFAGTIKDGYIWGRGSLDIKGSLIMFMEAIEALLQEGFSTERTIYLAFGHDEEIGGHEGATEIAKVLQERGIEAEMILDEGGIISSGIVPAMEKPVALIGTAEKGSITLKLSVNVDGGHSSMPEKETAVDLLSGAVAKLKAHPFPKRISEPVEDFINYLGPELPFFQRMVFANTWVFKRILLNIYEKTASGNATVRTTTAPTIFQSGVKDNLIPTQAYALINFRILPGETSEDVMEHVKEIVNDDRVTMESHGFLSEPTPVSSTTSAAFYTLHKTIREYFPETVVTPYLVVGATDSRHYRELSECIYRFAPITYTSEDLKRLHGINERIGIEDFENGIRFYYGLIKHFGSEISLPE